jgi:hypothetical protein
LLVFPFQNWSKSKNEIFSFPGFPGGLVAMQWMFPRGHKNANTKATAFRGHGICMRHGCSTTWVDEKGNLIFVWTIIFDHDNPDHMDCLKAWNPSDEEQRKIRKNEPTLICAGHLGKKAKKDFF